ncbi:MAG: FIST C-terminal domain-containing protein [Candidatus Riflebacteria bacterium]|nr:FIST C-terminal domain-containing protein [Candidatus Riflebacteria bacterium]
MEIGFGISIAVDAETAAKSAVERALSQNRSPDIAIVFASGNFDQKEVLNKISKSLKDVKIFGGSTSAELSNASYNENSVMVLLLSSKDIKFLTYFSKSGNQPYEAGRDLALQIVADNPDITNETPLISSLIFSYEKHFSGINYLRGLSENLPFKMPLSGGGSLNSLEIINTEKFFEGYQYNNREVEQNGIGLLLLKGKNSSSVRFSYAFESSWSPVAKPVKVTKAVGSTVYEVDNVRLDDYYKKVFGGNIFETEIDLSRFTFISTVETPSGSKSLIRTPGEINPEDGSSTFFPRSEMQDATLQLVLISRNELLAGASSAARKAVEALNGFQPSIVFAFSCDIRRRYLHSIVSREIEELKSVFGNTVPIIGFYAGGEYGPLFNNYDEALNSDIKFGRGCQFSTSISLFVIGEKDRPLNLIDYQLLLQNQINEDKKSFSTENSSEKEIEHLRKTLQEVERSLIVTEDSLKQLNHKHFKLIDELEVKNRTLSEVVSKNQRLQKILKQYTPRKVWEKSQKSADMGFFRIPDEEGIYSLMFVDVKGFTSYAEKHTPKEVIRELNRIFEHAVNIIYENRGDVDKFIGDCIFALFDNPIDAFRTAREIQQEMKALQQEDFPFSVRIGINHGRVIRGNVGGTTRRENTLIGDAVNFAQRLESNCTPGKILLSAEAFKGIDEELDPSDVIESRSIMVKGKKDPQTVYEITV